MSQYTGIHLYSSKEDYPLKREGVYRTFLTVKGEHVNMWLDDVEIKMNGNAPVNSGPLFSLVSKKRSTTKIGARFAPHYAYANDFERNGVNVEANKYEVTNLWYPDLKDELIDTSLIIHCSGNNVLDTRYTEVSAISVPYDTMLAISRDPSNQECKLTALGGGSQAAIGARTCGFIFIHDIELTLGKTSGICNTLLGVSGTDNDFSRVQDIAWKKVGGGTYTDSDLGELKSRPIVISGKNAVVMPEGSQRRDNTLLTAGALALAPECSLQLRDGATLKTFSNYLPPAYSIMNAWHRRNERPFQDASIVVNYMDEKRENTATFDEEGKVLLSGEMNVSLERSDFEEVELEAATEYKGMYPVTRMDLLYAGQEESFGPVTFEVVDGEKLADVVYPYNMYDNLSGDLATEVYIRKKSEEGFIPIMQTIDNDLFRLKVPIIEHFSEPSPAVVQAVRIPMKDDYLRDLNEGGLTVSEDALRLMHEYNLTEEELTGFGINIYQKKINLSEDLFREIKYYSDLKLLKLIRQDVTFTATDRMKRLKFFEEQYGVTEEELKALEIDLDASELSINEEQAYALLNIGRERNVNYERDTLNGTGHTIYLDNVPIQTIQLVDIYAPKIEELTSEWCSPYLLAEVARTVNGQEVISIEMIPVTWKEEFLPKYIVDHLRALGLYTGRVGYETGRSYSDYMKAPASVRKGIYRFTAVLPDNYVYSTEIGVPAVWADVIESDATKELWAFLEQALSGSEKNVVTYPIKIGEQETIIIETEFTIDDRKEEIKAMQATVIGKSRTEGGKLNFTYLQKDYEKLVINPFTAIWDAHFAGPLFVAISTYSMKTAIGQYFEKELYDAAFDLIIDEYFYFKEWD